LFGFILDDLDIKICRALITNSDLLPYSNPAKYSLREVARKLQVDHLTVNNRFDRLKEKGFISGWKVVPNPSLFGYKMINIIVDTPIKSAKQDMIRQLKLIHGVVNIVDHHGDSLGITLLYDSDESRSSTIELISRITHAENLIQFRVALPPGKTNRFTNTDWAIIRILENDGLKSFVQVAKEIGVTPRTVKNSSLSFKAITP
jgi:DNA-binding Lrp family transcriptional regulator